MAIKILIGGSPCTYWSIAQKNNRETEASGMGWELFKNYLIAKEKFKPDLFLYENNKSAAQAIKDQIAKELGVGVDPDVRFTYINSALVSAQNRQRFYVTNFGDIEQPEDRGILLKDILETGTIDKDKAYCLKHQAGNIRDYFKKHHTQIACEPVRIPEYGNPDKSRPVRASYAYKGSGEGTLNTEAFPNNPNKQVSDYVAEPVNITPNGKAQTIKSQYYKNNATNACCYTSTYGATAVAEPVRVGCMPSPDGTIKNSQGMRIYDVDGKSVNLTAQGGGLGTKTGLYAISVNESINGKSHTIKAQYYKNGVANFITNNGFDATAVAENCDGYAIPCEWDENGRPTKAVSCAGGKTYTVYEVKDGQITIKGKQYPIKLVDGYYIIRKLTVRECARLQTMPDDYCKAVSDSQAYKALGNGWTAEVIIHLLNHALKDVPRDEEIIVLSMYDGIGTGRYCLDKMGFTNVTYHAYEIDKYPIMVAMDNYPDIIQHGDAFAVRDDEWRL
jgi:DNA (cytosine-5)-methyltransferase 3A